MEYIEYLYLTIYVKYHIDLNYTNLFLKFILLYYLIQYNQFIIGFIIIYRI